MSRFFFGDGYIKNCNYLGEKSEADSERNAQWKNRQNRQKAPVTNLVMGFCMLGILACLLDPMNGHLLLLEGRTV